MAKRIDLSGKKFGEWAVVRYIGNSKWLCRCCCGTEREIIGYYLTHGYTKSCGCKTNKIFKDLKGQRFGEWEALEYLGESKWKCRCSCGKESIVSSYALSSGGSKSCGHATTGFKDITGQRFGEWEALEYLGNQYWKCRCSCGILRDIHGEQLRTGHSKSCGHATTGFKDLKGQRFGEWEVLEYLGNQYWRCRCSCGIESNVTSTALRTGHSTSCGHGTNAFKDMTGETIGDWNVISYEGEQRFLCRCSCGREKLVGSWLLRSGQSKSCGHSKIDYTDIIGNKYGPWEVLEYLGDTNYKCRCSCGIEKVYRRSTILYINYTECIHQGFNYDSLIGMQFNEWNVLEYIGDTKYKCRCSCGTERIIRKNALITKHTKSCGCKMLENLSNTLLDKYGDSSPLKIQNPREKWQIDCISNPDLLLTIAINFMIKLECILTLSDLAYILDISPEYLKIVLDKYSLLDIIKHDKFKLEDKIIGYLYDLGIFDSDIIRHDRKTLNGLELDVLISSRNIAIEINGDYWHSTIYKDSKYHQDKLILCNQSGIRLINLFEHEIYSSEIKIMKYLKSQLCNAGDIIYARNCEIIKLNSSETKEFLDNNHLQGWVQSSINYGLTYKDILVGVMTFGKPRFNRNYEYELIRLCYLNNTFIVGGAERLFNNFIKEYNPKSIICYCDASKFTGIVYKKLGFRYVGLTTPNYKWVNSNFDIKQRYQTMKQKLLDDGLGDINETEDDIMNRLGYVKIYDCGSYKYEYIVESN